MTILTTLRGWWANPRRRRELLVIASAGLIALGLAARYLGGWNGLHNGLMAAAALIAGTEIFSLAWANLRNRAFSIELLVTIATIGALAIGEFWEAAAVTFLFIFGAYLEARTLGQTRKVITSLLDLAPLTALVLRAGQQVEVAPQAVDPGETVIIKPGAKIPVDGEVIFGRSAVDESPITGESMPAEKTSGDPVYAGTLNQNGLLHVHATGIGADTTLARIIRRVEEAQEEKAPTQRFIERFARWYTPAIILLSVLAFAITRDIDLALTLLVIGCPGALVISTPVSIVAGIGQAARKGILIKGGEHLENAGKITAIALDKTGTLTQGKPRLEDVWVSTGEPRVSTGEPRVSTGEPRVSTGEPRVSTSELRVATSEPMVAHNTSLVSTGEPFLAQANTLATRSGIGLADSLTASLAGTPPAGWDAQQWAVIRWAAIAETSSEHPLARPILAEAAQGDPIPQPDSFETVTGQGVRASYLGSQVAVGTLDWMRALEVSVPHEAQDQLAALKSAGKTAVLVALDQQVIGVLGIADAIRPNAAQAVQQLRRSGVREIIMLTGDDQRTAQSIARQAGIDLVEAGLLPEDKLQAIRRYQQAGHVVAMTGDGINDAPAMAAADVGIAMGAAGTAVAIETADIALMADDLSKIAQAIALSKAVLRNIRQNVLVALVTVTALLAGVLLGEVHMAGGMLIHQVSVLLVIFNGMRLLRA
jgi:Zn2+/Cd2+-exporting ATPase